MAGIKRMCCYALQFQHRSEALVGAKNSPHEAILVRRICEGNYSTAGATEVEDLLAALRFLKGRGIKEVGVWGFSMGAPWL
jgi:dienelactone hydrolase